MLRDGRIAADGTPGQVKAAAGISRQVRFRSRDRSPDHFRSLAGVTAVHIDADHVTLHTSDADRTVWALYDIRHAITDLEVVDRGLHEAFLSLTSPAGP